MFNYSFKGYSLSWTPPERGAFFRLEVYKRVGNSQVAVKKWVGKINILVFKRAVLKVPERGTISLYKRARV